MWRRVAVAAANAAPVLASDVDRRCCATLVPDARLATLAAVLRLHDSLPAAPSAVDAVSRPILSLALLPLPTVVHAKNKNTFVIFFKTFFKTFI